MTNRENVPSLTGYPTFLRRYTQRFFGQVLILALLVTLSGVVDALPPAPAYEVARSVSSLPNPILVRPMDSHCAPLPDPTGTVIDVYPSQASELGSIVQAAASGDTILLHDGTYNLHGDSLWFVIPGVTLRSANGNREAVIIDGNYQTTEIVTIAASDITIADLTLQRASTHPIHVVATADTDTENTLIYNVHIIDPGEQAIKINPDENRTHFPDNGVVACSHIELTDAGRPHIRNDCYTGGVDAHQAWGWTIRDNTIVGFWCEYGLSEHGIHLWSGSRDTVVERNVLLNNARGVGFGLGQSGDNWRTYPDAPCPGADDVGHYDGIIRNNFIFASRDTLFSSQYGFDCGICLEQACGTQVLHNTVASTEAPFSSIEWRFANTDADIINNLVSHNLRERDGSPSAFLDGNLADAPLSLFVDDTSGDLHLVESANSAIDQGVELAEGLCDDDIDGDVRPIGTAPDIGADEYGIPAPEAVTNLRVTDAVTDTSTLTVTLRWTAPTNAVTTTLRYSHSLITNANWTAASLLGTSSGSAEALTEAVPYQESTFYFALKSQNAKGDWSALSNNAFWPHWDAFLPIVIKDR